MDQKEIIGRARQIIGEPSGEDEDWIIAPTKHAGLYKETAPALANILASSRIEATSKQYEDSDGDAGMAQGRFKKTAQWTNLAVFSTACAGALILAVSALSSGSGREAALVILGVLGVVAGGLGTMWIHRIDAGKYLEAWMSTRARAESYRLRLFELATAVPTDGEPESAVPLALLQLEYFRRYELDVQIAYYKSARKRHAEAAHKTLVLSGAAVLLAAVATGISGVLGAWHASLASLAALGVVGVALSAYVSRRAEIRQDARNAERYKRTGEALIELSGELDEVRLAVAGGHRPPLEKFVAAVHQHLSLEHRQWLKGTESTDDALKQLREAVANAQGGQGLQS